MGPGPGPIWARCWPGPSSWGQLKKPIYKSRHPKYKSRHPKYNSRHPKHIWDFHTHQNVNPENGFPEGKIHQPKRAGIFHLYIHIHTYTYIYVHTYTLHGPGLAPGPGLGPGPHVRYMYVAFWRGVGVGDRGGNISPEETPNQPPQWTVCQSLCRQAPQDVGPRFS